jgi:hypothetical protein
MNFAKSRIQNPLKRPGAEYYLLLTLLSFALSITLTRTFLFVTGYPQIGGGGLHIAHVLWGGLILFIAALLPLIIANRWVYTLGAILSGIGVGLFMDEVGKFITQDNNYFYPPAAPIIYAFFLLTVLVYFQVRRPAPRNPRDELYKSLDSLEDVLDHNLDALEREELVKRLQFVAQQTDQPNLARLAQELLDFLVWENITLSSSPPGFWSGFSSRIQTSFQEFQARSLTRLRFRAILAGGVGAMGLVALSKLGQTLIASFAPASLERTLSALIEVGVLTGEAGLNWFLARVVLEGAVGLMLFLSATLLALGKERLGIWGSYFSLLLSLTTVDLLLFYFEQFSMIATAFFQFILLVSVIDYRRRYLIPESPS